ncbi:MAG: glycoside hydrolase family 3 N-terminal domain-containing protein [Planctomycetota bacterium]|jgi:beta-glucosidase
MKYSLITTACVLFACFQPGCQSQLNQANNLDDNIESKIDALLEKMTLEEKIGQMSQATGFRLDAPKDLESEARKGNVGSFLNIAEVELRNKLQKNAIEKSRLGIPLIFGYDVIHGHRTVFPVPLGEAASWNLDMMEKTASISAKEARADGIDWTFSPMIDIARDPRWGRVVEGAGEDTYLGSLISRAKVRGYQGNNLSDPDTVAACLKHFAVYGASQAGREYHTTEVPLRTIRDVYLPPFKAGVEEGAVTLMSGFNDLNGVPTSGNKFLLTDILRNEWGFDGFVVSDWCSVRHMIPHSFAKDETHAGILAVTAGVDMEMVSRTFIDNLPRLVREGTVSEDLLDTAVRRILRVKFQLGLFDNPYVDPKLQETVILAPEHREVARQAVRESMVLLKNENALLPLNESIKSIALIGPLADNQKDLLGTWVLAAKEENVITLKQGLENAVGKTCKINYTKGCETDGDSTEGFAEAIETAQNSDLVIMAVGESEIHNGEAHLTINWELENIPAILLAWHPGVEGGNGITDVLFGEYNPAGKLTITFPHNVGQIPIYYNMKNTGRPFVEHQHFNSKYIDSPNTPLLPFGYGLSYTTFAYDGLKLENDKIKIPGTVKVSAEVTNTGTVAGHEVVQLYIRDLVGSVTRPVKELKGFKRIHLKPGETKTVTFDLPTSELKFYDINMEYNIEPGNFKVWIGPNSTEGLEGHFELYE